MMALAIFCRGFFYPPLLGSRNCPVVFIGGESFDASGMPHVQLGTLIGEKMDDIRNITEKIRQFRDERQWKQFHNHKDVALSLVLEASEVLEHFQWKSPSEVDRHGKEAKDAIADELADVAIYLFELADNLDINLVKAIETKMKKNAIKYPIEKSRGRHTKYNQL